ncbi:hypothetical protein Tco_0490738 [Tanacetum coccineum]
MDEIFDQMSDEVDQNVVDKQCVEIVKKNLLIENENMIANCFHLGIWDSGCSKTMTGNRSQAQDFVDKLSVSVRFGKCSIRAFYDSDLEVALESILALFVIINVSNSIMGRRNTILCHRGWDIQDSHGLKFLRSKDETPEFVINFLSNTVTQPPDHLRRWTNRKPLLNMYGNLLSVLLEKLHRIAFVVLFSILTVPKVEPKNFKMAVIEDYCSCQSACEGFERPGLISTLCLSSDEGLFDEGLSRNQVACSPKVLEASLLTKGKYALDTLKGNMDMDLYGPCRYTNGDRFELDGVSHLDFVDQNRFRGMIRWLAGSSKKQRKHGHSLRGGIRCNVWMLVLNPLDEISDNRLTAFVQ